MTRTRLPIVVSVPHGGTIVPLEVLPHCILEELGFVDDGDAWSSHLYHFREHVTAFIDTPVPRSIVDMNRTPDDRAPANPDGVVKSHTVQGKQTWRWPSGPPPDLADQLIAQYHWPYHDRISQACEKNAVVLGLDCHTMLAVAPEISPVRGEQRPLICVSNGGDRQAEPVDGACTAPPTLVRTLRDALNLAFRDEITRDVVFEPLVRINEPFKGGYITQHHGCSGPVPWIQLELSRALYIPHEPARDVQPDLNAKKRLGELKDKVLQAIGEIL